eukprot:jgi/Mesen1/7831/ME000417S07134
MQQKGRPPNLGCSSRLDSGNREGRAYILDPRLWQACAGGLVKLPSAGSRVVYWPQGHAESCLRDTACFPAGLRSATACTIFHVEHLADEETDEVFAKFVLRPEEDQEGCLHPPAERELVAPVVEHELNNTGHSRPLCFAKTLTQSDANNGGGFSVPRYCAETIFPPLDYAVEPPSQSLVARDVHGELWKFRHIYRGTPRRHLLTTGWSTFVNAKRLAPGDAVVFLRSASGELCVGVRRSLRRNLGSFAVFSEGFHTTGSRSSPHPSDTGEQAGAVSGGRAYEKGRERARRGGLLPSLPVSKSRVTPDAVVEAAQKATAGVEFEVLFFPRTACANYVVDASQVVQNYNMTVVVMQALARSWRAGLRCRMAVETDDATRTGWLCGTIAGLHPSDPHLWPQSLWRSLQIQWDEPDHATAPTAVSPWEVELLRSPAGPQVDSRMRKRLHADLSVGEESPLGQARVHSSSSPRVTTEVEVKQGTPGRVRGGEMLAAADGGRGAHAQAAEYAARQASPSIVLFGQAVSPAGHEHLPAGPALPAVPRGGLQHHLPPPAAARSCSIPSVRRGAAGAADPTTGCDREPEGLQSWNANARDHREGEASGTLCNVFRESSAVGRTLDLRHSVGHGDLLQQLAEMFGMGTEHLERRLVYYDPHAGWLLASSTPWPHFVANAKRAMILTHPPPGPDQPPPTTNTI